MLAALHGGGGARGRRLDFRPLGRRQHADLGAGAGGGVLDADAVSRTARCCSPPCCSIVCFGALGAGNGALFQLVPLRWPTTTAVAGSMIGEVGALGGGIVPNAMGLSKKFFGTYAWGFVLFAVLAVLMLGVMRYMQIRWTRTWAEKGGRARATPSAPVARAAAVPGAARPRMAAKR
ncbi:MAG: hypothetical protein V9G29_14630 [Burkholderiaceae bacterium]